MNWSDEQQAIFEWFRNGVGALVIGARAGTGKTTTIKAAFEHAPERRMLYAVFNKKNQIEAAEKIKDHRVEILTLHSLGFRFIKRVWMGAKPDDNVEADRAFAIDPGLRDDFETRSGVLKLVGFAKNTTINPTRADLERIADEQDIAFSGRDGIGIALGVLELSKTQDAEGRISFNDMVWLPVAMQWTRPWFDAVVIDEAQDMNLPQLKMARESCKPGGRVVVVGDDRQAIYGFRGAAPGGMSMMRVTLRAVQLGLTTTYRCPKAVVKLAAEIVPDYKAAPEAPEGIVSTVTSFALLGMIAPGDAILSRLNAPLMPMALSILRKNIPARIEGRDIGKQLAGMVRSMRASSVPHFVERVEAWRTQQRQRLEKTRNAEKKLEQTDDIADTLIALSEGCDSVSAIEARLNELFQDTDSNSKPAVVLSSVHKAKGLEWPRVFLLRDTFRPDKGGEESNIYYVALTRAQRELYFTGKQSEASGGGQNSETSFRAEPAMTPSEGQPEQSNPLECVSKSAEGNDDSAHRSSRNEKAKSAPSETAGRDRQTLEASGGVESRDPRNSQVGKISVEAELKAIGLLASSPYVNQPQTGGAAESQASSAAPALDDYNLAAGLAHHLPGNVIDYEGSEYVCCAVNASRAQFTCLSRRRVAIKSDDGEESKTFNSAPAKLSLSPSHEPSLVRYRMSPEELDNFLTHGRRRVRTAKPASTEASTASITEEEDMKTKKTPAKPSVREGKQGKVQFAVELLMAGGLKKSEIVAKTMKAFPGTSEATTRNTVNWCASHYIPTRLGKVAKFEPEDDAKPKAKPAKAKAAKKSKAPLPPKPAAKSKVPAKPRAKKPAAPVADAPSVETPDAAPQSQEGDALPHAEPSPEMAATV